MAWGTPAGKRVMKVDKRKHLVLNAVHPSPLSAHRGFFTCGHFKLANDWLAGRYGKGQGEIDWSLVPGAKLKELSPREPEKKVDEVKEEAKEAGGELITEEDEEALNELLEAEEKAAAEGKNEKKE